MQTYTVAGHVPSVNSSTFAPDLSIAPLADVDAAPATREGILLFARLMATEGAVTTYGAADVTLTCARIVAHVPDADGYTLAFLSVLNGEPEVTHLDFDMDHRPERHLLHSDGLGMTIADFRGNPWMHYRLDGAPIVPRTHRSV